MPDSELADRVRELQNQLDSLQVGSSSATTTRIATMPHTIRLPKFSSNNPNLWFSQIERAFRLHGVTNDDDKFDHATVNLDAEFAVAVEDLLTHPPDANKYEILKNRLLDKFAESPESKLRRLLQGGETTGLKPSEILAHMRRLAPESSSEPIIRSLFLSEMPQNIRPILTIWEENDLEKLAKIADKMQETVGANTLAISSNAAQLAGTAVASVSSSDSLSDVARALRSLEKKVDTLQNDFKRLQSNNRSRSKSRGPSPRQPNVQPQTASSTGTDVKLCFYHQTFGDNAKKLHGVSKFQSLLQEFVDVTIPARKTTSQHEVRHHIEVTGAPISDRPRRLAGEKLAIAKAEVNFLIKEGICRPSNSPWSSPLHMVSKRDAPLSELLRDVKKNDQRLIDWTANRIAAFEECKRSITNAALLAHPLPNAKLALHFVTRQFLSFT
ncbi:hypothetical protein ACLKA6_010097 [Drosophila palustris]